MAKILNKVLDFVGWEVEEEEEEMNENNDDTMDDIVQPQFRNNVGRKNQGKVLSMQNAASKLKVVIMQPETFDDAQSICDHVKAKKPVVINLEGVEKECAQRIIDFLSGAVYSLEGSIQKVSNGIFVLAPCNVDIMNDIRDEFRSKGTFSWVK